MGRIRRSVNWKAGITDGDTGENGFRVIGDKNPYIVHVGETEVNRSATVRFEQCELSEIGEYKHDDCYIYQREMHTFTFQYYDYDSDTYEYTTGVTVQFLDENDNIIYQGVTDATGICFFRDTTGNIESVKAHVVSRNRRFNEGFETYLDPTTGYQTSIDVIRLAQTSATYTNSATAYVTTQFEYDNDEEEATIEDGATGVVHMLHEEKIEGGHIKVVSGNSSWISYNATNKKIRFNRSGVNETSSQTTYENTVVKFYYQNENDPDDAKTVTFYAPSGVELNYTTTYKLFDNSARQICGVTDTSYAESAMTDNLYDTRVFAYVAERPVSVSGTVALDIVASEKVISTTMDIKKMEHAFYTDNAYKETSTKTFNVMSNEPTVFTSLKARLHVGNKEKWDFNSYRVAESGKGGSTQFRLADIDNAAWACDVNNPVLATTKKNHPGFLRRTENPKTRTKIASIKYKKVGAGETEPQIVSSGITTDNLYNYLYMGSNDDSPTTTRNTAAKTVATWVVLPSEVGVYPLSHSRSMYYVRHTFKNMTTLEKDATTLGTSILNADYRVTSFSTSATTYPQFGVMQYKDAKYFVITSKNYRHCAIISRDPLTQPGATLESEIFTNNPSIASSNETVHSSFTAVTYLSAETAVKLFDISNNEVTPTSEWGSDSEWKDVMNKAKAIVESSTITGDTILSGDVFDSRATEIYGFLFDFDVSDSATSAYTTSTFVKDVNSGIYTASTEFYDRWEEAGYWSIPSGSTLPPNSEYFDISGTEDISVRPIMISMDSGYSGLTTVVNRIGESEPLKTTYQLAGERGMLRSGSRSYHKGFDEVEYWHGIEVSATTNSGNEIRNAKVTLSQRDRYHFRKNYLTNVLQDAYDQGYSPQMWKDDIYGHPGETRRNVYYLEYIQLKSTSTSGDVLQYMADKIKTDNDYSSAYDRIKQSGGTVMAVILTTDEKIKIDTASGKEDNPYNIGPWKYDFVNYPYATFYEYFAIKLADTSKSVTITFSKANGATGKIYYAKSSNSSTWYDMSLSGNSAVTLSSSQTSVYFRGNLGGDGTNGIGRFNITTENGGTCKITDNIMSLVYSSSVINHDEFRNDTGSTRDVDYMFKGLFSNNPCIVDASELYLMANTKKGCYQNMFANCTGLKTGPRLVSWHLQTDCYTGMFSGCTSLHDLYCMATDGETGCTANWMSGVVGNSLTVVTNNQAPNYLSGKLPTGATIIQLDDGRS